MGSQKKEAILKAKWAVNFVKKKQNRQRMSFEFLDCMALATIPAKLLLDLLLPLPICILRVTCRRLLLRKERKCVETIC